MHSTTNLKDKDSLTKLDPYLPSLSVYVYISKVLILKYKINNFQLTEDKFFNPIFLTYFVLHSLQAQVTMSGDLGVWLKTLKSVTSKVQTRKETMLDTIWFQKGVFIQLLGCWHPWYVALLHDMLIWVVNNEWMTQIAKKRNPEN